MINKKFRKLASAALAGTMILSLAACGSDNEGAAPTSQPTKEADVEKDENNGGDPQVDQNDNSSVAPSDYTRTIRIGTWYDHYYSSKDTDIYANPEVTDIETAQMQLDNVRRIEEKYNVRIEFVNLTWEGTIESINTSIMSGTPDCDIYEVDLQFGVPAALNGYAMAIDDFAAEDNDIFTDQTVFKYLEISGIEDNYLFSGSAADMGAYPLGFNMDMINEANLENPQDLYDKGEWTWEKFREYCRILRQDTDGDGNYDVYGYSGWWTTALNNLLMSNGAHIAGGLTEELSSPATIEALDFLYQLYQVDKTARPWDTDDWDRNVTCYTEGKVAFWSTATWVQAANGLSADVGYEIGIVPWPVGPSGNVETNSQIAVAGNWYMIPVGVERPELVYQVIYEYSNWYNGDLELRDDTEWAYNQMETDRNFEYLKMMGETAPWFDLWPNVTGFEAGYSMITPVAEDALTAAQAAEQYKQLVQDFLDVYMN